METANINNTEKLLQLVKENPTLPVVPLVYSEIVCDDGYAYWLGQFGDCDVSEYACYNERFYTDREELEEDYYNRHDEEYDSSMSDDEITMDIKSKTESMWTKAIIVWIGLPD